MKKRISITKILAVIMCILVFLTFFSCGKSSNGGYEAPSDPDKGSSSIGIENSRSDVADRKIIYKANINIETEKYDEYMANLKEKLAEYGGYFATYNENYYSKRVATVVIKIPVSKYESMKNAVCTLGTVVYSQQTADDVTAAYLDVQSRIDSLKAQKQSLDEMAKNATNVSQLIEIQEAIGKVTYELEKYEKKLLAYDDLISYSTITLNIDEVEKETEPAKENAFKRIGKSFVNNAVLLWNGIVEIFVFIVGALPFVAVIGGVVFLIVFFTIRRKKK